MRVNAENIRRLLVATVTAGGACVAVVPEAAACPKCRTGVFSQFEDGTFVPPIDLRAGGATTQPVHAGDLPPDGHVAPPEDQLRLGAVNPTGHGHGDDLGGFVIAGGMDVTTAYFHRGYNMGDEGLILQPHATISKTVYKDDRWTITPYGGFWASFMEGRVGAHHGAVPIAPNATTASSARRNSRSSLPRALPRHLSGDPSHDYAYLVDLLGSEDAAADAVNNRTSDWGFYETELMAGVTLDRGPLRLDLKYMAHLFPGGDQESYQEIGAKAWYDVASLWQSPKSGPHDFAAKVFAEVDYNIAGDSPDPYTYLELGAEPSWIFPAFGTRVAVGVPVVVGMSLNDFYLNADGSNETLGYYSVGLTASVPLGEPGKWGAWYLNAGVTYMRLEADTLRLINDGNSDAVIGTIGVSFVK